MTMPDLREIRLPGISLISAMNCGEWIRACYTVLAYFVRTDLGHCFCQFHVLGWFEMCIRKIESWIVRGTDGVATQECDTMARKNRFQQSKKGIFSIQIIYEIDYGKRVGKARRLREFYNYCLK